tara:strand:- start:36588 stop:36971 length:384 start_codon:yes stop_codon:yes gene_type:complete
MADNTSNGATFNMFSTGQFGSSLLNGDGASVDLDGGSATRYVGAITMLVDTTFEKLENLGDEIGSISTVTAQNDHDSTTGGFGAAGNATNVINTMIFPKGVTIYGRWDLVELNSGTCICYFAPRQKG